MMDGIDALYATLANTDTDHVPAPSGHAPRLAEHEGAGDGVTLHEPGADGAWITCENACNRVLWE
jgi:hypothetical protein